MGQHPSADDLVQETLVRVLAALPRIEDGMLEPYAIVTARNVVASMWRDSDRHERNLHRVVDLIRRSGRTSSCWLARSRPRSPTPCHSLTDRERETLLAHEVAGDDTRALASRAGSTAGAVAAQLNRTRARLRVEYLLALEQSEPPTRACAVPSCSRCPAVTVDGNEHVDAARHVLECDLCGRLSVPLLARGHQRQDTVQIPVSTDSDVVAARRAARELAARLDVLRD